MQTALLMEQEVGPARGARWTVGRGGRLSVCLSVFQRLPPGPEALPFSPSRPGSSRCGVQYISNKHSGEVSWRGCGYWSCPTDVRGSVRLRPGRAGEQRCLLPQPCRCQAAVQLGVPGGTWHPGRSFLQGDCGETDV